MTAETLCETNEMHEITNLAQDLISHGAELKDIITALKLALE